MSVIIDNLRYSLSGTSAEIIGYYSPPSGDLVIPSTITYLGTTYTVTSIREYTFVNVTTLTSVTIPSSIISIGFQAFGNVTTLTSVNFNTPSSLTSIADNAFSGCTSLTSVTLPSSLTSIGNYAFSGCTSLTSITINSFLTNLAIVFFGLNNANTSWVFNYSGAIPDGVCNGRSGVTNVTIGNQITSIGSSAFQSCSGLTSITIPNSVTTIGNNTFQGCTGLTSVTLPSSLTSIGNYAFRGCTSLTSITINSFLTNLAYVFFGLNNANTSWVFNYSGAIPDGVCKGRSGVTNVTIGNQITSIGNDAFNNCPGLTLITIPSLVASIGNNTFQGCTSLRTVTIANGQLSGISSPATNVSFFGKTGVTRVLPPTYNDNNVLYSYIENSGIASVIPSPSASGILTILSSFIVNNVTYNVTSIGVNAFLNCTGLTSVTIPSSVTRIGNTAFQGCTGLTSITIPNSVTSIGESAFNGCTGLTSITFLGLIPTIAKNNFGITGDNVFYNQSINAGNPNVSAMLAMFTTNAPLPIIPICFVAGTPVETDQCSIAIDKINPAKHTIRGKKIVAITKTVTIEDRIVCIEKDALGTNIPSQKTLISRNHEILYNKKMIKAKQLIGQVDGVYNKKYNGEVLYNVLLETHEKMIVNNLIVETLNPTNIIAQLYNGSLTETERNNAIININKCANDYKKVYGKMR